MAILRHFDLRVESSSMKTALGMAFLFLCAAVPLPCYSQQPALDEILKKVSETYQNLQSYQFVAEKITEIASVGSAESPGGGRAWSNFHKSDTSEIMLAALSPGKFRLDVKDEGGGLVLVSDGQTKWTYLPKRKQYTEASAAESAETDALKSYRTLLVDRFRNLQQYSSKAVLEKDNQLKIRADKVACYVVKIQGKSGAYELWIDKNRYIVWKSKYIGPAATEGISFQETTTINLSQANINTDLEKSLFQFTPPDKAAKVTSLESRK
jgi:outer membrane lipoprotein-sorting protein